MTRVLMLPVANAQGTVGASVRALSIARALEAFGARVAFSVGGPSAAAIAARGYQVYPCPVPTPSGAAVPIRSAIAALTWTGLADVAFNAALVRAELAAVEDFQPDVLWAEFRPTAAITAAAAGLPLAAIANWPTHPDFPANRAADPAADLFNTLLRQYGQAPVASSLELVFLRSHLRIAPTLRSLEPELAAAEHDVVFVGHTVDRSQPDVVPPWFEPAEAGDVTGFVYLSVSLIRFPVLKRVLEQTFAGRPFRVVCAIGYHVAESDVPAGGEQVRFFRYLPAMPVIARSRFVISHAGHDTVMSSLYHGVPSLVFPGASSEREYNALQVQRSGAGISLPYLAFRPARLWPRVQELLDGHYKESAGVVSRSLRQAGGCEEAAGQIVSLHRHRARSVRSEGPPEALAP